MYTITPTRPYVQHVAASNAPKKSNSYKSYVHRQTMESWRKLRARMETNKLPEDVDDGLERLEDYIQRWRSIRIIYFTMFLMALGFSIILTGIWPFLSEVRA